MSSKIGNNGSCGIKRGLMSMRLFIFSASALFMFSRTGTIYLGGIIRTLERRFSLRSSQTGFLFSCDNITSMFVVLFFGYFGRWGHKPRIICIINLFTALCFFIMAIPHFVFDSLPVVREDQTVDNTMSGNNVSPSPVTSSEQYCLSSSFNGTGSDDIDMCNATYWSNANSASLEGEGVHPAYYVFVFAQLLSGVGTSGVQTLGLTYIEENAAKSKISLYVGIVNSMYTLGPVGGLMLSAVTLRLPETLSRFSEKPEDSSFIGCWWLGYVICGTLVSLFSIPLWFYPKSMTSNTSLPEERIESKEQHHEEQCIGVKAQIKEFPRCFLRLVCNKMYLVNVGCAVSQSFIVTGINVNMVRYIEIHFLEQAFVASLIAAVAVTMAMSMGTFLGGFLMSRLRLSPRGGVRMMIAASSVFALGLFALMFLNCPQVEMAGNIDPGTGTLNVMNVCNRLCNCKSDRKSYVPVCGSDNLTYFSSCFAGCSGFNFNNGTYEGCSCVGESVHPKFHNDSWPNITTLISATARHGFCGGRCQLLIPFAIISFVTYFIGSMAIVPGTLVNFRVVESVDKSFSIAFSKFIMDVLGNVPAPILFGGLVDSSCRMWQHSAAIPSSTWFSSCSPPNLNIVDSGSCLLFNTSKVRRQLYGTTFGIKLFELVLIIVLYKRIRGAITGEKAPEKAKELQDFGHNSDDAVPHRLEEKPFLGHEVKEC